MLFDQLTNQILMLIYITNKQIVLIYQVYEY